MSVQVFLSNLLILVTILQLLFAGYVFILNAKAVTNRSIAALLVALSIINLANNFLQGTYSLEGAIPYILLLFAGSKAIGPLIYLTSVAILRPQWIRKYRWLYWPVIGLVIIPTIFLLFDITGISQRLISNFFIITLPDPIEFTTINSLVQTADQGILHDTLFGIRIGFLVLTLICPALVVAWIDRKKSPTTSQIGLFFFFATLLTAFLNGVMAVLFDETITSALSSLIFFILFIFTISKLTSFAEQTRQVQKAFRRWSVFAKLMGTIIVVMIAIVIAIGIAIFAALQLNTIQTAGENLHKLALAESRILTNELLFQATELSTQAENVALIEAINQQNLQYELKSSEQIQTEINTLELEWKTAETIAFREEFLLRYIPANRAISNFTETFPNHLLTFVTDRYGAIVTGSAPPSRYNSSQNKWWHEGFKKGVGEIYISAPFYDANLNLYYTEMAVPVFDNDSHVIGVLFSRYNLQPILERLSQIQIGQTGDAALINSLGFRLPDSPEQTMQDTGLDWDNLNNRAQSWLVIPYLGQDSLISWVRIGDLVQDSSLSALDWDIVFSQSIQEVLASVSLIRSTISIVLVGTVFLSLILAIILSRIVTYPLNELTQMVGLISKGNLSIRAEELTEDEFGTLAKSFNIMTGQLKALISGLEQQVDERTQALQQRALQIQAAVEVGNTVASIREMDELLTQITHLISQRFGFYHVGIFLLSEDQEFAVLHAANSPGGQRMLARNHKLKVGEVGIVGFVASQRQPRIVHDVGEDAVYFNNPDLPETRSEMGLPLISAGKVLGVLDVQSTLAAAFTQEDITILQLLADQLAVAIDNAYLFTENQKALTEARNALEAARRAYRDLSREGWRDLARVTKTFAYRADQNGITPIIEDLSPALKHTASVGHLTLPASDTLAVPIKIQDHIAGVVRFKKGEEAAWSAEEINLIETLTNQLGSALESARLYKETQTSLVRTEALYQIGRTAIATNKTEELLQSVADTIAGTLPAERVLLLTLDMPGEKVLQFIENNAAPQEITPDLFHQLLNGLTGWAIQTRTFALSPKNIPDPRESPDAQQHRQENNVGSVIVAPMFYQDAVLGTITAINTQDQSDFSREDADLLTAMANQVAAALTNTELLTQTRKRALQLQTSAEISRAASSILELEQLLPQAVELIRDRFDLYYVGIFLADEAREWAVLRAGTGEAGQIQLENGHRLAIGGESMIGQCVVNRQGRIALDVGIEAIHFQNPHLPETRSEMALPLNSRTGTIGAITIQSTLPSAFTQEDISVFQTMADQLASAIDNALLFEANRRRLEISGTLLEITQVAGTSIRLSQILREITQRTAKVTNAYRCMVYLLDENNHIQPVMAQFADGHADAKQWELFQSLTTDDLHNVPLFANTIQERKPILVNNVQEQPALVPLEWVKPFHQQTILSVPLISQNQGIGILMLDQISPVHTFSQEEIDLAFTIAGQTSAIIQNARLFQQTQEALAREQREHHISSILARAAEKFGSAFGESDIRQVMINEIHDVILPDQITLYEWQDDHNAFLVTIRLTPGNEEDDYAIGQLVHMETRPDLWKSFSARDSNYSATRAEDKLIHEHYIVPWLSGTLTSGVIEMHHTALNAKIRDQDKEAIQGIIRQAAVAIQSARLFEQTQDALTRTEALYQISQAAVAAVENLPTLLQSIVDHIAETLPADRVLLITLDLESRQVTSFVESGLPTESIVPLAFDELMEGLTGWVIKERKPALSVKGVKDERESEKVRQQRMEAAAGSIVVVPLSYRDRIFGTLTATNELDSPDFSNQDVTLLVAMANQAAAAIENARLLNQTQHRALQLQTAAEVSRAASSILDLAQLLPQVVELIRDRFNLYYVGIFLVDDNRRYAVLQAGTGEAGRIQIEQGHQLRLNHDSMIGRSILTAQAQIDQEIGEETTFFRNPHLPETRSEMALPLIASGQVTGAMTIQSTQVTAFTPDDITVLQTLADQLAIAIENARFVAETRIRAENERLLNQITAQLSRTLDLDTILKTAVQEIGQIAHVHEVAIHIGEIDDTSSNGETDFLTESQQGLRIISPDQKG